MSKNLGHHVEFVHAMQLAKSTREAPWKFTIKANGQVKSFVLQLDQQRIEYEYQVLKVLEAGGVNGKIIIQVKNTS